MTYLTAHRASAVRKYGDSSQRQRPSQLPRPYSPDTGVPGAANDNFPRPANDNLPRPTAPRVLSPKGMRVLNGLKSFRSALDVFGVQEQLIDAISARLAGSMTPINMAGWNLQTTCSGLAPTHFTVGTGFCSGPAASTVCFSGSIISSAKGMGTAKGVGCRVTFVRHTHSVLGVPRYAAVQYWWIAGGGNQFANVPFRRSLPRVRPRPVLDPFDLPIYWFGPNPVPLPGVLVPHLVNDPLGSTRTNGDKRPVSPPRRPPPENVKEVKLRAAGAAAAIIIPLQKAMHATTELLDHIDSFHEALPKHLQAKGGFVPGLGFRKATPQAKVKAVMSNFGALDWNEVIKNVIKNEIEDRTLGRANAGANKALNNAPGGRITRGFAF